MSIAQRKRTEVKLRTTIENLKKELASRDQTIRKLKEVIEELREALK